MEKIRILYTQILNQFPDTKCLSGEALKPYTLSTFSCKNRMAGVIIPSKLNDLEIILPSICAAKFKFYTISGGKNWGYGSMLPEHDNSILIDLRGFDRIEQNGNANAVIVEPAVTQQQLYDYLTIHRPDLMFSVNGAAGDSTIIGNAVAGGYGNGPHQVRWDNISGYDMVLANGLRFNTINGNYSKYLHFPDVKGLLKSSTLGTMLRLSLDLPKIPENILFTAWAFEYNNLAKAIDALTDLKRDRIINANWSVFNAHRLVSETSRRENACPGDAAMTLEQVRNYISKQGYEIWNSDYCSLFGCYNASEEISDAQQKIIKKRLDPIAKNLVFYKITKKDILEQRKHTEYNYPIQTDEPIQGRLLTFSGIARSGFTNMAYWRKKWVNKQNPDLDKDKCGYIWIACSLEAKGNKLALVQEILNEGMMKFGFEPFIVIDGMTDNELYMMSGIIFDYENPQEDKNAKKCYIYTSQKLEDNNISVFRIPNEINKHLREKDPNWQNYLKLRELLYNRD